MARKRLSMCKIKEILRLKWESRLSVRGIAGASSVGKEMVREYLRRASETGLSWSLPEGVSDTELECLLFPSVGILTYRERKHPDWAKIYQELTKKGLPVSFCGQSTVRGRIIRTVTLNFANSTTVGQCI